MRPGVTGKQGDVAPVSPKSTSMEPEVLHPVASMVDRGKPPFAHGARSKPPFGTMLFGLCVRHLGTQDGETQVSLLDAQSASEPQAVLQTVPLHVNF